MPSPVTLTLFDMGWGGGNVFDHCAQTLKRIKLKLGDFYGASKKVIFGSLGYPMLP